MVQVRNAERYIHDEEYTEDSYEDTFYESEYESDYEKKVLLILNLY